MHRTKVTIVLLLSEQKQGKGSVIRKNHEDVIQLPMDHNWVPPLHVHPTGI